MRIASCALAVAMAGFVLAVAGCQPTSTGPKKGAGDHAHDHGHDHALGPHQGHILELGEEEYHAEWTHDDSSGKVAVYILDKEMKKEVPIDAQKVTIATKVGTNEKTYELLPVGRTTGENPQASQFETTDKQLVEILTTVGDEVTARLEVTINGKSYPAKFEAHEDHGHKH